VTVLYVILTPDPLPTVWRGTTLSGFWSQWDQGWKPHYWR